jgi:hypothetical protein
MAQRENVFHPIDHGAGPDLKDRVGVRDVESQQANLAVDGVHKQTVP